VINMKKGHIIMSINELERSDAFLKLKEKILNQTQVAELLGISVRQVKRIFKKYTKHGTAALISKKRGQKGNHRLAESLKDLALAYIREKYRDFGPLLAHEKLIEIHKLKISLTVVRKLMIQDGLWNPERKQRKRVYQLRERRSREGELVQIDGSPHDWFEGRAPKCTLLMCVDDATGKILAALFAPSEALWPYYALMRQYVLNHGRALALYSDKHGVFKVNKSGALTGSGLTQFGRAMKDLNIEVIFANSPQAKGRIERKNRVSQDRLVKEMRLHKISTIEEANAFLPVYIEDHNRRFAVVPKDPNNAHRPLLSEHNLDLIFTIQEFRQLSKSLAVSHNKTLYQIKTERDPYTLRKTKVLIYEKEDKSIEIFCKGKPLLFEPYNSQEKQGGEVSSKELNEVIENLIKVQEQKQPPLKPKYRPSSKHPWKHWIAKKKG
jgi:transposase